MALHQNHEWGNFELSLQESSFLSEQYTGVGEKKCALEMTPMRHMDSCGALLWSDGFGSHFVTAIKYCSVWTVPSGRTLHDSCLEDKEACSCCG